MSRNPLGSHRSALPILGAAWCAVALTPLIAQVPDALREVSFGSSKQPRVSVTINGRACECLTDIEDRPRLAWPVDGEPLGVARDAAAAARWLNARADDLGYGSFRVTPTGTGTWGSLTTQKFGFRRDGLTLFDREVTLFFDGADCIGLHSRAIGATAAEPVESETRLDPSRHVYYVRRDGPSNRLIVAERRSRSTDTHEILTITPLGSTDVVHEIWTQKPAPAGTATPGAPQFTEFNNPTGVIFPDQIWADSKGLIWVSNPSSNSLTSFDPTTNTWKQFNAAGTPDGMSVDDRDQVWTGLYATNAGLGRLDIPTGNFQSFPAPYPSARMAIPTPSSTGTIWVTDHIANRVSEFDPATSTWPKTIVLPVANSWVVEGDLDPTTGDLWFAEFRNQALGHLPLGASAVTDIKTPSTGGAAFPALNDGKVYFSYWSLPRLGEYDTVTKRFVEYAFPISQSGGPISIGPNGDVMIGTRVAATSHIMVFDPKTKQIQAHAIPQSSPGLKDGLTVAPDGAIWFTQSSRNKIARLVLQ